MLHLSRYRPDSTAAGLILHAPFSFQRCPSPIAGPTPLSRARRR
ncbi:hypothetical protein NJ7G_1372 [Natrinema sp. J7-2]|nr:hypothetical protein NJ7G_1372 [Natrinema sp. J7-2]